MPKRIPVEAKRVPLNCLISPATKEAITGIRDETNESQGEIIDRAIVVMVLNEIRLAEIKIENRMAKPKRSPDPHAWRAYKAPLLKPSEKKK